MQLKPSEIYAVVRQLDDPYDSDTYYVQAKIRNAETDELIATLNLEDKGDQRFRKNWEVTADPSGEGFYIDIETIVYSDSGYTVVSDIYRRQNQVLLVQERNVPPFHGGGGGDVDYKKVKGAVEEAVGGQKKDKRYYRKLEDIGDALNEILSAVRSIDVPEYEKTDLSPVLERIEALQKVLKTSTDAGFEELGGAVAEIPKEHVDLNPVLEKIESMKLPEFQEAAQKLIDQAREIVGNDLTTIVNGIKGVIQAVKGISFTAKFSPNVKEPEEEKKSELPARVRRFPMPKKKTQRGFVGIWILISASLLALSAFVGVKIVHGQNSTQESLEMWKASSTPFYSITPRNQLRNLYMPVGTATTSRIYSNTYCINNGTPDCITAWPAGSGSGGGIGTTTPWTVGNLAQVVDNDTVTSIATSSLGLPTFSSLLSYLTLSAWYATTTDALDEGLSNLYFTNARAVSALAGLYEVPLTFGDGLTRTVNDIDCDTANTSTFGCLTDTDWDTFNNKQAAGNYITALTGEVTATGPGSVAATIANNIIDEANLLIAGSPTDGYLLQASSTLTGGFTWVSTTTLGITGGSIATPVSIADGGTNASSFTTTDGLVYFDGTSLVNADLTWSPTSDTLDSGVGQTLDILGQDGLFLDGQGTSGLFLRSNGLIQISSNSGSGGYVNLDTDALTVDRTITVPDEAGTLALGTGSTGNCAEWSSANTLTAAASPCGTGGSGGGSNWKLINSTTLTPTSTNSGIGIQTDFVTGTSTSATSTFPFLQATTGFRMGSDYFTDLTGTGLQNVGNALTLNATGDWTGTIDGNNFAGGAIGLGDILYGSGAGALSELAIGATGGFLSVVGGLPAWSATSSMKLNQSDILTGFTQGSVVFATTSGTLSQDNAGLFFDSGNNALGIGDSTPGSSLIVSGSSAGSIYEQIVNTNTAGTALLNFDESDNGFTNSFFIKRYGSTNASPNRVEFWNTKDSSLVFATNNKEVASLAGNGDFILGSTATATAPFWWDVSATTTYVGNGAPTAVGSVRIGGAGVSLTDDGDGALTFLGLSTGSDESITVNLDDTANNAVWSTGSGVVDWVFSAMGLVANGISIDSDGTAPASVADSLIIGDGSDTGGFELEDGGACIGDGGCTAPADGGLGVELGISIDTDGTIVAPATGSLLIGDGSDAGTFEMEDGPGCFGDGGCAPYSQDGSLLVEAGLSISTTTATVVGNTSGLMVQGVDNGTAVLVHIPASSANVTTADTFIDFTSTAGSIGSIAGTAVSGTIAYNTFTGSHYTEVDDMSKVQLAYLLEATGEPVEKYKHLSKARLACTRGSESIYGAYGGDTNEGMQTVLSIGTGMLYVANKGDDLEVGDMLMASDTCGYAERQKRHPPRWAGALSLFEFDDDTISNKTVAKLMSNIEWKDGEAGRYVPVVYLGG